jgi:hypothetical protein
MASRQARGFSGDRGRAFVGKPGAGQLPRKQLCATSPLAPAALHMPSSMACDQQQGILQKLSSMASGPEASSSPPGPPHTISASWDVDLRPEKSNSSCEPHRAVKNSLSSSVAAGAVHALTNQQGDASAEQVSLGSGEQLSCQKGQGVKDQFAYGPEAEKFVVRAAAASRSVWLEDVLSLVMTPGALQCC